MATVASGLSCPHCDSETRVINTSVELDRVVRTRICKSTECHHVFTTIEDPMGSETPDLVGDGTDIGMPCPNCGGRTTVDQTRRARGQVRRRRQCLDCNHIFKTKERPKR